MSPRADAGAARAPAAAAAGTGPTSVLRRDGKVLAGDLTRRHGIPRSSWKTGGKVEQIPLAQVCLVVSDRPATAPQWPRRRSSGARRRLWRRAAGTKLMIALTGDVSTATHKKGSGRPRVCLRLLSASAGCARPEEPRCSGRCWTPAAAAGGGSYIIVLLHRDADRDPDGPHPDGAKWERKRQGRRGQEGGRGRVIGAAAGTPARAAVGAPVADPFPSGRNHLSIPQGHQGGGAAQCAN